MPKQGKTPKKKSKEKTPQKSGESEYPAMEQGVYSSQGDLTVAVNLSDGRALDLNYAVLPRGRAA